MGEVIYLYPDQSPDGNTQGLEGTALCLNYEPSGYERKSWIYRKAPGICAWCAAYRPEAGDCRKLRFKTECICLWCGDFCLDRPGTVCRKCGHRLAGVTTPSDW